MHNGVLWIFQFALLGSLHWGDRHNIRLKSNRWQFYNVTSHLISLCEAEFFPLILTQSGFFVVFSVVVRVRACNDFCIFLGVPRQMYKEITFSLTLSHSLPFSLSFSHFHFRVISPLLLCLQNFISKIIIKKFNELFD